MSFPATDSQNIVFSCCFLSLSFIHTHIAGGKNPDILFKSFKHLLCTLLCLFWKYSHTSHEWIFIWQTLTIISVKTDQLRLWHQNVLGLNSGFAFTTGMAERNHVTAKSFCFAIYKRVIVRSNWEGRWWNSLKLIHTQIVVHMSTLPSRSSAN